MARKKLLINFGGRLTRVKLPTTVTKIKDANDFLLDVGEQKVLDVTEISDLIVLTKSSNEIDNFRVVKGIKFRSVVNGIKNTEILARVLDWE